MNTCSNGSVCRSMVFCSFSARTLELHGEIFFEEGVLVFNTQGDYRLKPSVCKSGIKRNKKAEGQSKR